MEQLNIANKKLKTAHDDHERDYKSQIDKLSSKEEELLKRLSDLDKKKLETAEVNGNVDAADDDVVEINAGGKIIAAKRSTLTQLKGTKFEALFSGRWDKKLQRDSNGRIFFDVNSMCFQAIVDYLNEMTISSEDNPPNPPSVDDEHKHILQHQLEMFGLLDKVPTFEITDSNIIKNVSHVTLLHDWLKEDGSDGEFSLLFRSSRDGLSAVNFHSRCDNQGHTLTIIETTDGFVFGGYSNTPWSSTDGYCAANKAFLFVLSGSAIASPCRMKLKNADDGHAVHHNPSWGPVFGGGHDLIVHASNSNVYLLFGYSYESGPSQLDNNGGYTVLTIKEMEVFQVSGNSSPATISTTKEKQTHPQIPQVKPVNRLSEDINKALNVKQESLLHAESEILHLEDSFIDDCDFIAAFASGHTKDVIVLNVSGTMMATKRSTLQAAEDSVLAQQFDDSKWTEQGCSALRVNDWTPDDVSAWAKNIHGIPAPRTPEPNACARAGAVLLSPPPKTGQAKALRIAKALSELVDLADMPEELKVVLDQMPGPQQARFRALFASSNGSGGLSVSSVANASGFDDVGSILKENGITGRELLTLNMEGLKMIGIERAGTLCLLLEEIKALKQASLNDVTLIEHSPYCFGKILDYLRLNQLHSQGLVEGPALPTVCDSQKSRFEKVVKYYFPGESAKFILG